jgi:alkylation response protein AidB-like acyl-CoA dehydrogenase
MSSTTLGRRHIDPMNATHPSPTSRRLIESARAIAVDTFGASASMDHDGAFPVEALARMAQAGLLEASLPSALGGPFHQSSFDRAEFLATLLRIVGWGSLPLGRIYEGHVNALELIIAYGTPEQAGYYAGRAHEGALFGVWNTQAHDGVTLEERGENFVLDGSKIFASGAGHVDIPLITARSSQGQTLMIAPRSPFGLHADLGDWKAHGMRASASGRVNFTGVEIGADAIIGKDGDYLRQPMFAGGAWRFCAVQLGGIDRLLDVVRAHLRSAGRDADPYQMQRVGQAAILAETAQLWVDRAARHVECADLESDRLIAYVNLARLAVERAALDCLELVHRSIGLAGFQRTHPVEQLSRDLATYLRQPAPDKALADAANHVLQTSASSLDLWASS